MHQPPLSPQGGVTRRTLISAIAVVVAAQAVTIYVVHRISSRPAAPSAAPASIPEAARQTERVVGRFAGGDELAPAARGPVRDVATRRPVATDESRAIQRPAPRPPWGERPLDEAGQKLAEEVRCAADDLRLLADERGRVGDAAQRDLLAGRDAGRRIAQELGLSPAAEDQLAQVMVGFMMKRVTMRESFRGTRVTPEAIDDAARADALASAESNFDGRTRNAVAAGLSGLPDLTADVPRAP
jgi:hypothetical protein